MQRCRYNQGLHDLGNGCYAWLQPDEATHSSRLTLIRRQRALRVMIANVMALTPEQRIDWARLVVSHAGRASPDWGGGPRRLEALVVCRGFGQGRRTGPAPP